MNRPPLGPALDRVLLAARDRRERRGASGDAQIRLSDVSPDEALALDALLAVSARRRPVLPGRPLKLRLSELEAALRACAGDPRAEYERVGGRPLRDLPADRATARAAREDFRAWLLGHPALEGRPRLAEWVQAAIAQGRLHSGMRPLIASALVVLDALPAGEPVQRTVLAARLLDGDPHALDAGTPLHSLLVALLIADAGLDPTTSPRMVWAHANVTVDPVSSTVLALGLTLLGDGVAAQLVRAADGGHVILSHGQLAAGGFAWPAGTDCFSAENPSVLVAAEQKHKSECRPLICTGGHPSDAVRLLLGAIVDAGGHIHHHGDFDEAGLLIFGDLEARYGARPWRYDLDTLESALTGHPEIAPRRPVKTFASAVAGLRRPLPEELCLDDLLSDLGPGGRDSRC